MEIVSILFMLLAFLLFFIGIVSLIIKVIRHKKKKPAIISITLSIILLVGSVAIMPADTGTVNPDTTDPTAADLTEELVNFTAEYCMAYMDYLNNPYSFTVKSAWAHEINSGDNKGKYSVYVRFTTENSLGGTISDEIGTEVIDEEALKNFHPEIHTWGSEPTYKTSGYGQELNAEAIQTYINQNYK